MSRKRNPQSFNILSFTKYKSIKVKTIFSKNRVNIRHVKYFGEKKKSREGNVVVFGGE